MCPRAQRAAQGLVAVLPARGQRGMRTGRTAIADSVATGPDAYRTRQGLLASNSQPGGLDIENSVVVVGSRLVAIKTSSGGALWIAGARPVRARRRREAPGA